MLRRVGSLLRPLVAILLTASVLWRAYVLARLHAAPGVAVASILGGVGDLPGGLLYAFSPRSSPV